MDKTLGPAVELCNWKIFAGYGKKEKGKPEVIWLECGNRALYTYGEQKLCRRHYVVTRGMAR